jgi:hypothetical protein
MEEAGVPGENHILLYRVDLDMHELLTDTFSGDRHCLYR